VQQHSLIFISSCSDMRQSADVARHADPFAIYDERRRMVRQKIFLQHTKIHREIAEQSTIALLWATMI